MESFLWGASTSATQVEGDLDNDWTQWADRRAEDWAAAAKRWGSFRHRDRWETLRPLATAPEAYRVDSAVGHETRYEQDIQLLADHGLNAYRFSVAWSRLQPAPFSPLDDEAVAHYHDVLDTLEQHDVEPLLTCWHFTHPHWFHENGSWRGDTGVEMYADFVRRLVEEYGDRITYWITLNEPMGWLRWSHIADSYPPALTRIRDVPAVASALVTAHRRASDIISERTDACVGVSMATGAFEPYTDALPNRALARLARTAEHGWFIDRVSDWLDWLGVNYYYHYQIDVLGRNLPNRLDWDKSDMRWPLSVDGFEYILRELWSQFGVPLIVTEHGLADATDTYRSDYIEASIAAVEQVRNDGVPVNGYCHWSLLDNVEWDKGRWPRFGLVEVDYDTLARTPRDSFRAYQQVIQHGWTQTW